MELRFHIMKMADKIEIPGNIESGNECSLSQFKKAALTEFWKRYSDGEGAHGLPEHVRLYRPLRGGAFPDETDLGDEVVSDLMLEQAFQIDRYLIARFVTPFHPGQ